ncbi:hypothetical protein EJ02DRAFT_204528 [Clathrospora elynae]|uniref:Uncharacterized protein n=1 Tax=Clathrospora elynae TaxID=706981 RepID=A0A6A5SP08_9PLEO|nr:hypothetical protein EJ02DRAFT_204528 [Clathrospora elynae]
MIGTGIIAPSSSRAAPAFIGVAPARHADRIPLAGRSNIAPTTAITLRLLSCRTLPSPHTLHTPHYPAAGDEIPTRLSMLGRQSRQTLRCIRVRLSKPRTFRRPLVAIATRIRASSLESRVSRQSLDPVGVPGAQAEAPSVVGLDRLEAGVYSHASRVHRSQDHGRCRT